MADIDLTGEATYSSLMNASYLFVVSGGAVTLHGNCKWRLGLFAYIGESA